jgi:hypothetical protein
VSSECFQLYYTCSDRMLTVVLPSCSFHIFSHLTVTFAKLSVILRPLYMLGRSIVYVHVWDHWNFGIAGSDPARDTAVGLYRY